MSLSLPGSLGAYDSDIQSLRVAFARKYTNLQGSTAAANIKSGAGGLHAVSVNTKSASAQTLTLYDALGASGTTIAKIDVSAGPETLSYGIKFQTGLSYAFNASIASTDVTVSWA